MVYATENLTCKARNVNGILNMPKAKTTMHICRIYVKQKTYSLMVSQSNVYLGMMDPIALQALIMMAIIWLIPVIDSG